MRIEQLRYFVTIVDCASIQQASKALFVSQQALSQSVQSLEKEYSVKLLLRTSKGVSLTTEGMRFYDAAMRILAIETELRSSLEQDSNTKDDPAHLVVGIPFILKRSFFPRIISRLKKESPHLTIDFVDMPGTKVIEAVREERVDAGVLNFVQYRNRRYPAIPQSLQLVSLYREQLALMVSQNSQYAHYKSVSLKTKLEEPLIVTSQGEGNESPMLSFVKGAGIEAAAIIETESWEIASQMVVDGVGAALSSSASVPPNTCRVIPYKSRATTNVSLVLKDGHPYDNALRVFVNESLRMFARNRIDGNEQPL